MRASYFARSWMVHVSFAFTSRNRFAVFPSAAVDRAQRQIDVRVILCGSGTYGHLVVEDLRDAINLVPPSPFAASLLEDPRSTPARVQKSTISSEKNQRLGMERETGFELATLSLGS